ncbi:MAG TPA: hydroxymethylbilane synthase [Acidimicrobiales bacterium]|nr:hydroxymethylbilane synthase [Acidimicrobiales bacterium]
MAGRRLVAATRGSTLARWQTERVAALLRAADPEVEVEALVVETEGDRRADVPIEAIGGRGVFAKEVQSAVLEGRADFAVHSAKDLPSAPELQPEGLVLACVPERADPRDALVGSRLADLPRGAVVATGSVRRRAQLAHARPDLVFAGLRGNIETRLAKAPQFGAIVMAYAALVRLGREDAVAEVLDPSVVLPQVAQGALAVECRADDDDTRTRLAAIEDRSSRRRVDAERAWLAGLGGGCDLPVGALATEVAAGGDLRLDALIASLDGATVVRDTAIGSDPVALGARLATVLLDERGARALLAPRP